MTLADLGLANLKIRISTKGDDREKGLNMISRNEARNNKKPESKKRKGSDDDFKVDIDAGKEKRRRRMEYRSIKQDYCERVFPAPPTIIHRGGWDREKKPPKSHESWGQGCQDKKKTPPLQKEKESCRSDHSSSPRATIDEGCTTSTSLTTTVGSQLSPSKALRAAQMKKRYAHLIFKANHQALLMPHGQQERERLQKQEIAEKARIEQEIKAAQTLLRMRAEAEVKIQRQREREAARIALEKIEKTVEFNDAWQITRDFESLLNAPVC